tara:strand:+ start:206 stop:676 length:471 start_codon:yes stop_codon:yes gene_type:complete
MAERMTDKFTKLFTMLTNAIVNFTKAGAGLPITVINTTPVQPLAASVLTITMPTDAWVCGIYPTVTTVLGAQVQDVWCDRIDIAGFNIWDMQGAVAPVFGVGQTLPLWSQGFHGYARPFLVRQGDVITVTFTSLNAAATRGTVAIDSYRADHLTTA